MRFTSISSCYAPSHHASHFPIIKKWEIPNGGLPFLVLINFNSTSQQTL